MSTNITDMPYARWLEQTLHDISELPVQCIVLAGVLKNNEVYTAYYNTSMGDKLLLAGIINQDATLDTLAAQGLIEYEEEEEDDNHGEEEK